MIDTPIIDSSPRGMADLLDGLAQTFMDSDREVAGVLTTARESLRAIGYNRWARDVNRRSRARVLRRRHQGRKGVRHA